VVHPRRLQTRHSQSRKARDWLRLPLRALSLPFPPVSRMSRFLSHSPTAERILQRPRPRPRRHHRSPLRPLPQRRSRCRSQSPPRARRRRLPRLPRSRRRPASHPPPNHQRLLSRTPPLRDPNHHMAASSIASVISFRESSANSDRRLFLEAGATIDSWGRLSRAVSQLLWSHKGREEWFSLGENHEKVLGFGVHQLRSRSVPPNSSKR